MKTHKSTTDTPKDLPTLIQAVSNGLTADNSRAAYEKNLLAFLEWWNTDGQNPLSKAMIQRYKNDLQKRGLSPASINLALSALRKMALEASENGLLDLPTATAIQRIPGVKTRGVRSGNWLTRPQAQELLNSPAAGTLRGFRDRAMLAVLVGAGLRRSEVARLNFEHIQQRDGRWVIVDLVGKGNRVRSVPIPSWTKAAIDQWSEAGSLDNGKIFRPINKSGVIAGNSITPQAVYNTARVYLAELGFVAAPHDLRRTYAKLASKGGARLEQIQLSLGHASIQTTEKYLGIAQDLTDAPCDRLGLSLEND